MKLNPFSLLTTQTPLTPDTSTPPAPIDVAIIGAGLAGLSTAQHLLAANATFTIFEARPRVGGRVANHKLRNGGVTELGGAFVGPTQDHALAAISSLGLHTFPQHDTGALLTVSQSQHILYAGNRSDGEISGLGISTDAQLARVIAALNDLAATLDPAAPWIHPKARQWDSLTLGAWLDGHSLSAPGRAWFDAVVAAIWSATPPELSFLYALTYIASAGNLLAKGTLDRLMATTGGGQESRVVGGSGLIATRLAERVGWGRIALETPVRRVSREPSGLYRVSADNGTTTLAKHVVVAMSPPLAARIQFAPPLPAARDQLMQRMFMGSLGKATAVYDKPFWREEGVRGQAISDRGMVRATFDVSPANGEFGAMLGFLETDQARKADGLSEGEIATRVTEDYVDYFGPKAADVKEWAIMRWDNEEFSRGGPVAVAGPGTMSAYGPALRRAVGGIHWAGTETASHWIGYMNGAIESGERVAIEVLRALSGQ